jgi:hypothetical protein
MVMQQTKELKEFQSSFCSKIQKVILDISSYLHQNLQFKPMKPEFHRKLSVIHSLCYDETKVDNRAKIDQLFTEIYQSYNSEIIAFPSLIQQLHKSYV